ncbi:MAG TPA: hypothetical protein VH231_06120 [Solirubrobacteraceae bacterium]|nr:hypothetical protein [Solirubrobacteraceae bacterium]
MPTGRRGDTSVDPRAANVMCAPAATAVFRSRTASGNAPTGLISASSLSSAIAWVVPAASLATSSGRPCTRTVLRTRPSEEPGSDTDIPVVGKLSLTVLSAIVALAPPPSRSATCFWVASGISVVRVIAAETLAPNTLIPAAPRYRAAVSAIDVRTKRPVSPSLTTIPSAESPPFMPPVATTSDTEYGIGPPAPKADSSIPGALSTAGGDEPPSTRSERTVPSLIIRSATSLLVGRMSVSVDELKLSGVPCPAPRNVSCLPAAETASA